MAKQSNISEALQILIDLGMPRAQQNERSALCFLALLGLTKKKGWADASSPLIGITPMMDFARIQYGKRYKPNTRETFRRQTMHQLVDAGIAPTRPVNSPRAVYQIAPGILALVRTFGTRAWNKKLHRQLQNSTTLAARYERAREMQRLPVRLATGETMRLSPGNHSKLIKAIVEQFAQRFVPGGVLIYAGDTGEKWGYFDKEGLRGLGVKVDGHGKMPDVILHYPQREWLVLVEAVTSHGPVDGKRHLELARLFAASKAGLVYVTAFPSRMIMARYLPKIAWETDVWVAEAPTHLIHFNGSRFLGPYS